jgi:hypothetical protein
MKKFLGCCSVLGALIIAAYAANPATSNFAGTWLLNKEHSKELPPQLENIESYTLVVTQDEQQLTVET